MFIPGLYKEVSCHTRLRPSLPVATEGAVLGRRWPWQHLQRVGRVRNMLPRICARSRGAARMPHSTLLHEPSAVDADWPLHKHGSQEKEIR